MQVSRREILKLGATTLFATLTSPFVSAQNSQSSSGNGGLPKNISIDGNISYNAGWVVPLEDKNALLELESKKTKEREDQAKQKSGTSPGEMGNTQNEAKSFGKRFQEVLSKVKGWF